MNSRFLLSTCLMVSFSAVASVATPETANTLKTHTQPVRTDTVLLGEARRSDAQTLEDYLLDKSVSSDIKDEFGAAGLRIIRRTYANNIFRPVWTVSGAEEFKHSVYDIFEHGIIADDVFSGELDDILRERFSAKSLDDRVKADVDLSVIWLRYAKAISGGLSDEGEMVKPSDVPIVRYSMPFELAQVAKGEKENPFKSFLPKAPQYNRLKKALAKYRLLQELGGWDALSDGAMVKPGETDERIPALRLRLAAEGFDVPDRPIDQPFEYYDEALASVVKTFQTRHGLEDDGILGGRTLEALNESVESKINRIAESMYRWRMQGDLGNRYIWANIPSFSVEGWNEGRIEIRQRTIVGKARFATPEFSEEVEYVVANPKWYLPVSIVRRQKLPKLRKDPSYATKYGYNIFDRETGEAVSPYYIDWTEPGVGSKYRFVQQAGEGNALGEMKIMFPNQYSIYLHGTPGEHLFEKAQRTFSSGCVRLEDPVAMARWIAKYDQAAEPAAITEAIDLDETRRVDLATHVPVHITYMSVTVDDVGEPHFWRDVYNRVDVSYEFVREYEGKRSNAMKIAMISEKTGTAD